MNKQFETAFAIFRDFYGEPKWNTDPKDGQDPEKIIEKWCEELKGYSVDQIRQACAWITRKRRVMTFPTLDVLLCELSDKEKTINEGNERDKTLKMLLSHEPKFDDLTIQRTMWTVFGERYMGYDPETDLNK